MPLIIGGKVTTGPISLSPESRRKVESLRKPSVGRTVTAAFELENSFVSAAAKGFGVDPGIPAEDGYNPALDTAITDYLSEYGNSFSDSKSRSESLLIKMSIDREKENKRIVGNSGGLGIVSTMAAGLTDPLFLPLMFMSGGLAAIGKTAGVVKSGLIAGGVAGSAELVAEAAKHATQETRTIGESALNVGGATLLSGLLGSAAKGLSRVDFGKIATRFKNTVTEPVNADVDFIADMHKAIEVGDDVDITKHGLRQALLDENEPIPTGLGLEKLPVSPLMRLLNNKSVKARLFAQDLFENPIFLKKHLSGKAVDSIGGSVETRVKQWNSALADSTFNLDDNYAKYRGGILKAAKNRITGKSEKLSRLEFNAEVSKALRRGDVHHLPEVTAAAKAIRRTLFEPLKDAAIEMKLLPKGIEPKGAVSYLTRVYNTAKIIENRPDWDGRLMTWLKAKQQKTMIGKDLVNIADDKFINASDDELLDIVDQITDHITGVSDGRVPYEEMTLPRGSLKERVLDISDIEIEDFLEQDINLIMRRHINTMAPDIELSRKFGSIGLVKQVEEVSKEYDKLIRKAKNGKETRKLSFLKSKAIKDIEAGRDRIRGTYMLPSDPNTFFYRAGRFIRDVNFLRMLGGMTLSAIPDIARPIAVNGLKPVSKGLKALIFSPKTFKMAKADARSAGSAWEMVLNSRMKSIAEIGEEYSTHTAIERHVKNATGQYGKIALMSRWNDSLKQFSGVVISHRILSDSVKASAGKLANKQLAKLARAGISKETAVRIAKQFKKFGVDGDLRLAQGHLWDDKEAFQAYKSAVLADVDRTIVTPGTGEKPLWMSSELGQTAGQFKAFAVSSHHKVLVSDLQLKDAAALNGFLLSVALGGAAYGAKQFVSGRELSNDPSQLVIESLDRSGVFGFMWDVNNTVEKLTAGNIGVAKLVGGKQMSRYASRNIAGALLGPTADTIQDFSRVTGAVTGGEIGKGDVRAMRKLMPFQNLFYMRTLLNSLEKEVSTAIRTK